MKIALAQTHAHVGDIEANILDHIRHIKLAIKHGAKLIIFPELSITGYRPSLACALSIDENDGRLKIFQTLADQHGINILIGAPIKAEEKPNIGLIIFQPYQVPHVHFKQYLPESETTYFAKEQNQTITLRNHPQIALAICYESSLEHVWQNAVDNDAKIFIASVANDAEGIARAHLRFKKWAKTLNMTALMVNITGQQEVFYAPGETSIYTPLGAQILKQDENPSLIIYDHGNQTITTDDMQ